MSYQNAVTENPRAALFEVMEAARAGMLGLTGSKAGLQPMTHFADEHAGLIWFISATDTELVRALEGGPGAVFGAGKAADYVLVSPDHDVHANIRGTLSRVEDEARLDALWSPLIGAWFKEGRHDPRVALLCFTPEKAEIWASTTSTLKFGFEMIRANLTTGHSPDVGTHAVVDFHKGA